MPNSIDSTSHRARLIALEGIDGAGKGTQAKRLYEALLDAGKRVTLLGFPRYADTRFGGLVGDFLNGKFGPLDQVHPMLASLLYAGDRFESKPVLEAALAEYDIVLCDRYVGSNLAHQGVRFSEQERAERLQLIHEIEHEIYGLPCADVTILLDISAEASRRQIATKAKRDYTEQAADLQESDLAYQQSVRAMYLELANTEPGWCVVECERDGSVRSVEEIAADVWAAACSA
ncbi:dTMP kinase [Calycomorphotria hydatis]|uniref:Thymidylate kinase n=1 Tax=Calycomorphotria hydatis TaxID=2528027 RepID=A0A517TDH4_9PLAN|nr:dTMP kinase [Calycomorphotria hydatis]QDT66423.1 Thymidylate kinase [Calycomorphotria hydatis]